MSMREITFTKVVRIIFGIALIIFGLNGFFMFLPGNPQFNEEAMAFLTALFATGYMVPVMSLVFVIVGLLFVINKCAPFGAVLIAPFTLNILLFHLFLDFKGWYMGFIFTLLNAYLLGAYWEAYKPMCE